MGHTHLEFSLVWRRRKPQASESSSVLDLRKTQREAFCAAQQLLTKTAERTVTFWGRPGGQTPRDGDSHESHAGRSRWEWKKCHSPHRCFVSGAPLRQPDLTVQQPLLPLSLSGPLEKEDALNHVPLSPSRESTQSLYGTEHLVPEPKRYAAGHAVTT